MKTGSLMIGPEKVKARTGNNMIDVDLGFQI